MPTPSQEARNKNVFLDRSQHCPHNCLGGTKAGQKQGKQAPVVDMCVGGHEGLRGGVGGLAESAGTKFESRPKLSLQPLGELGFW